MGKKLFWEIVFVAGFTDQTPTIDTFYTISATIAIGANITPLTIGTMLTIVATPTIFTFSAIVTTLAT
jgi:hypothetical protein